MNVPPYKDGEILFPNLRKFLESVATSPVPIVPLRQREDRGGYSELGYRSFPEQPSLIRSKEKAQELGITVESLNNWRKSGLVKYVKFSRKDFWYFSTKHPEAAL